MTLSFQTGSILGAAIFGIGVLIRMYVMYRVRGMDAFSKVQNGDMQGYRNLVAQGKAPFWPLVASYSFCAAGFLLALLSILLLKSDV